MKKSVIKKISIVAATAMAVFAIVGVGTSYAAENENMERGMRGGSEYREGGEKREGMRSGKRGGSHFFQELTEDERESMQEEMKSLSEDERTALHEEKKANRESNKQTFENFSGITKEDAKEIRQSGGSIGDVIIDNGKTESEIKDFFEDQAEERVEDFVERHDVSSETETNLRAKISEFVEQMFERLFKTKRV